MSQSSKKLSQAASKDPGKGTFLGTSWRPLEALRQQVDRLFDDFARSPQHALFSRSTSDIESFWKSNMIGHNIPAVDITEKEKSFEMTAELPGMEEKDIQVRVSNGNLTISGEKRDEKEEKRKDYHLSERHYGSFERVFSMPKGVDVDHIEASFKNGILTISLPKRPEAVTPAKLIQVKSH